MQLASEQHASYWNAVLVKPCTIDDRQFAIATFFDQNQMGWTNTDIFLQKIMKQKTVNDTELNQTFKPTLIDQKLVKILQWYLIFYKI